MQLTEIELALVTRADLRVVEFERADQPLRAAPLAPARDVPWDGTALPCLEMAPPAQVLYQLPALTPGVRLCFAVGFDQSAYKAEPAGQVRFRLESAGEVLWEATRPYGARVPLKERAWLRAELELAGRRELRLSTQELNADGTFVQGEQPIAAGFALLEVQSRHARVRERASRERPNVIFVLVDTLRADRLGCYGWERAQTPALDRIAALGTLYERAYAASSWTFPSTASLLTRLSPPEHGLESHTSSFLAQEHTTIAEAFQQAGWTTAAWVVNPLVRAARDFDQGFESFQEYTWSKAGTVVDDVGAWLNENGQWRHFLYLHLGDPHEYHPSEPYRSRFVQAEPPNFSMPEFRELNERSRAGVAYDQERFALYVEHMSALYDATVAEVDAAMQQLWRLVEQNGQAQQTLFVFTSDHGEAFLEHGLCLHGAQLYDEFVNVPLILAGPKVPAGLRISEAVENRFLAPTLCLLAGVPAKANLAGESLLERGYWQMRAREPIFFSTRQGLWPAANGVGWLRVGQLDAVRVGELLYLLAPRPPEGARLEALFDLSRDPSVRENLVGLRAEDALRMRAALERWQEQGARTRPEVLGGGQEIEELMRAMGYIGEDDLQEEDR